MNLSYLFVSVNVSYLYDVMLALVCSQRTSILGSRCGRILQMFLGPVDSTKMSIMVIHLLMDPWHIYLSCVCIYKIYMCLYICMHMCIHIRMYILTHARGFPGGSDGKESTCQCRRCKRHGFELWVRNITWRRKWQSILIFVPGKISWTEEPGRLQSMGSQRV